jgi:hypothetical protein
VSDPQVEADLHLHSHHSDGEHPPQTVVEMAHAAGLRAVALTDHDTMDGWPAFSRACEERGIEPISGVELSCRFRERDLHLLGYFVRPDHPRLMEALARFRTERAERGREIVRRLNGVGVPLTVEAVERAAGGGVVGRPHVADALVQSGLCRSYDEAFRRYIGHKGPGHVAKAQFAPSEAIALVHEAGGLAVLAHPGQFYDEKAVGRLAELGLDGVEVIHPRHGQEDTLRMSGIAYGLGLSVTGGSDYHGPSRGMARVGDPGIPYEMVQRLKERLP